VLERYLKYFRGGSPNEAREGQKPAAAVSEPEPTREKAVETRGLRGGNVVTHILDVETSGSMSDTDRMREKFIVRRPLLDRSQHIVGYEMLLRKRVYTPQQPADESLQAIYDETLVQCVADLKIDRLLQGKLAFISLSAATLEKPLLLKLPKRGVVLAVHPEPGQTGRILTRCKELKVLGYRVGLDGVGDVSQAAPFLGTVEFVRIDVSRFDAMELSRLVDQILKVATPELIANNVETDEDFDACRKLYFHYFEGYYFARLQPAAPHRIDSERARVIELLKLVRNRSEISELEQVFRRDAVLSYKLLRYINAPVNGLLQEIRSIAHALIILGYEQLYRWLTLLLFSSGSVDPRAHALLKNALVRARLTELLGWEKVTPAEREGLFIVGIFSLLDVLLNMPMERALEELHLPEPVALALTRRAGVYGSFLELAVACESADQSRIARYAKLCGLDAATVNRLHGEALVWAEEIEQ
jgi:EAL and modified HD-GYP domain-containing signal transduction protein